MSFGKWLTVTISLIVLIGLTIYVGTTGAFFVDDEQSTQDSLGFQWGFVVLNDSFDTSPWDQDWDENGTTDWEQSSDQATSGSYSAKSDPTHLGYLTSDEIDASESVSITLMFNYYPLNFDAGEVLVQAFNGVTYTTLFDLRNYSTFSNGSWCTFNELITDSQYFIPGFRLRFVTSGMTSGEAVYVDDVNVITDSEAPGIPQNLTITQGDRENFLDWDDNSLIDDPDLAGYNLYSNTTGSPFDSGDKVNTSVITESNYTVTGLDNGTTYYYIVRAIDLAGNESEDSNEVSAAPADIAPHAPTGLTATAGDTEMALEWNANTDYDLAGYNLYRGTTSGSTTQLVNTSGLVSNTTSNYTDTGLTNGTTYYYVVKAVDVTSHESTASNEASDTPDDLPPENPTGLTASAGNRLINLDWTDSTDYDLAGYNVYRSTTSGSGYVKVNSSMVANTTSNYTDTELTGGTTYYYVVKAVDLTSHESGASNEANETPTDLAPGAPTGLSATDGDRQVLLDWDDHIETDVVGYNIYRSTTSGTGYTKVNTSVETSSAYTDTTVTGGITYYYVVKAVDAIGQLSPYSGEANTTPYDSPPAVPTGLATTDGDRQAIVYWNANGESDLAGYNIYRSTTSGSGYVKINTSLLTSANYTDTGLVGGTTYYYVVNAVDLTAHTSSYSAQTDATPYDSAPDAPMNLDVTPGDGSATLNWNENTEDDLAGYNIYRTTTSGLYYVKVNTGLVTNTTYLDSGLTGGTTYYYAVTAVDLIGHESVKSGEDSVTPSDLPPGKPTGLVATPHDHEVELDWDDSPDGDLAGYNVYRSTTSGSGYSKINSSLVLTSNYNDTTALNDQKYYYVVTAVDITSSESVPSNEKFATPNVTPDIPTGLSATKGDRLINLDWNDNTDTDLVGYNVYRSLTAGSGFVKINTSLVSNTTSYYIDTGLVGGTTYYYKVTAVDAIANESDPSTEASAAPDDLKPSAPANLSATAGDLQASLNWDDNTEDDLAGYNVYRSLTSGSGYTKLNSSLVTTSNYTDTGLNADNTYYYIVNAVDLLDQESDNSTEASVTPDDYAPAAPTGLTATPGDKTVLLVWNANQESDVTGYNVYRSETAGSGYVQVNGSLVTALTYTDTGLVGGVTYYYVVKAVDAHNLSPYSGEDSATVSDADPATPTGLTVQAGNLELLLDWDDNSESDLAGYNVYCSTTGPSSGFTKLNGENLITTSSYTHMNLTAGSTYYYKITAVDYGSNESPFTTVKSGAPVGPTLINDSFDGIPWYDNFDDNDATLWIQDSTHVMSGTYSAYSDKFNLGYLTTDNLYASLTSSITIDFWYYPHSIDAGDLILDAYNGTAYNTIYDMASYPATASDTWCHFSEVITDSQYFVPNFRLRLTSTGNGNEAIWVDDYVVITDDLPPLVPTGLVATAGEQQNTLDWDDNSEPDLDGYNVYRRVNLADNYTPINSGIVRASTYTDISLNNSTTYYYVVTAVDIGGNESEYSTSDSATPQDFVPTAPTGLTATPGDELVELSWNSNPEIDIAGYNVYRSTSSGSGSKQLVNTGALITSTNFTDTGLNGGTTYYYMIKAIDDSDQYSNFSSEVSATAIDPPPAAPTGVNATAGDRQAVISWNANSESDINGYNLYRSTTSGSGYTKVNTTGLVALTSYTDTGLTGDVTYYYVLTAVDLASNESETSNETSVTPTDPAPAAAANLTAVAGDKTVTLNWNDNTEDDLDGYNLYRSLSEGSGYSKVNAGVLVTSDYVDTGLTGYVTYYYKATAVDLAGHEGAFSNIVNATPDDPPPSAPADLFSTTEDLDAEAYLWWDAVNATDLAGYNIYRKDTLEGTYEKKNTSVITETHYLDTGLQDQTTYYYVVTAIDDGGFESGYSPVEATPIDLHPSPPTGLVATPHDATVSLNWNDNLETDIAGYWIYRGTDNASYSLVNTGNLSATSAYTDTGLTNNTTYFYYVTAFDLGGNESTASNSSSARPDPTPAAPTDLLASQGDRLVTLTWSAVPEDDIDGYNVYRNFTGGQTYTRVNTELVEGANYTDTELTGGITYYYVVTAVDLIKNESIYSSPDSATPVDNPPAAVANLIAGAGDRLVSLTWDANTETDLAGYNLYRSVNVSTNYIQINGSLVVSNSYTDTELIGGTVYYYKVKAEDDLGQSGNFSSEVNATPNDLAPVQPTGFSATAGDRQVTLDWTDNTETDLVGYNVWRSVGSNSSYSIRTFVTTSNFTDTNLTGGTTYYYKVEAKDAIGQTSPFSAEDSAVPTDAPPLAPTGLGATPHAASISLDWTDNNELDLAGYNVYRSLTTGTGFSLLNTSGLVSTSNYTDTGLTNDTTYYYYVTAVDAGSNPSPQSSEVNATPNAAPAQPQGLIASEGNGQVNLSWNDNAEGDLLGYNVYRSGTSGGPYTKINTSIVESSVYTDINLSNGTTYYYTVTAVDSIYNESIKSDEDSATPSGLILLNDGFESANWKQYWDGNGATDWASGTGRGGIGVSAQHERNDTYLTSDTLDASGALTKINVKFWFTTKDPSKGPLYVEIYNPTTSTWTTAWANIQAGASKNVWTQFSQDITDSGYFAAGFKIRFSGGTCTTNVNIDDVYITTD